MAMPQFLVQTSSIHEGNHHDEGKMCLKYFDLQQPRKTTHNCRRGETSDLKWNRTDDRRAKKTNPPTQVECQEGTAMELDDDAFPVKFLHDFIAYICKYPWQQWNWSWREDLISFVREKIGHLRCFVLTYAINLWPKPLHLEPPPGVENESVLHIVMGWVDF